MVELRIAAERLDANADDIREMPAEIYGTLVALGADRFLLGVVGSWRDCMEDSAVLELLREWNRLGQLRFDKIYATTTRAPRRISTKVRA